MTDSNKVIKANRAFRRVRITRKSSTNEWVVRRIGSTDDGYFTDDVDDAVNTARRMEHESSKGADVFVPQGIFAEAARRMAKPRKRRPIKVARQSVSIRNLGSKTGSGPDCFEVILRRGGKPVLKISAEGPDQYRRAVAAADLWARGATIGSIEKLIGKHRNS